jgi:hypothetical protein
MTHGGTHQATVHLKKMLGEHHSEEHDTTIHVVSTVMTSTGGTKRLTLESTWVGLETVGYLRLLVLLNHRKF